MENIEAKILLKNLLNRVETQEDGSKQLTGVLTADELDALFLALTLLEGSQQPAVQQQYIPVSAAASKQPEIPSIPVVCAEKDQSDEEGNNSVEPQPATLDPRVDLDLGSLSLPSPPTDVRLCLDFGTAMSKATLVEDNDSVESEAIHVLQLGVPGDQEEINEVMLISSVYIDNEGSLWFGKAAVDLSMVEGGDGSRQRLDNIKRRLSEDGWNEEVGPKFNPTDIAITNGDMVLAYLMFMTWAVNSCLDELGYPWNLRRRFAMPCLSGEKGRETIYRLKQIVGEAQVLADTFYSTLKNGIPLSEFIAAVKELRSEQRTYPYVAEDITEPLGVTGSIMSWKAPVDMLIMVIDVGAGTSDLSLNRIHFDPVNGHNVALEIPDTARGLTEAGNYLDRALIELIIKKCGVTSEDSMWINIRGQLELEIRDYKETLFNDGIVFVNLINGSELDIELEEFLSLDAVQSFGESLRDAMVDILSSIDSSWVNWVKADIHRNLVVALTGGGAELPMVTSLAEGSMIINGVDLPVVPAMSFPNWLRELDANLEADYARVAVSLGGARKRVIKRGDAARITAGDVTQSPTLGGYYLRGN